MKTKPEKYNDETYQYILMWGKPTHDCRVFQNLLDRITYLEEIVQTLTVQLNIPAVIHSAEEEPIMTFGERGEDGFVKVYRNGEHTCNMFVFTAKQADKIEQIHREVQEELRKKNGV